jgi:hypothetical protein
VYVGTEEKYGNPARPLYIGHDARFTAVHNGTGLEAVRITLEKVYGTT